MVPVNSLRESEQRDTHVLKICNLGPQLRQPKQEDNGEVRDEVEVTSLLVVPHRLLNAREVG